MSENIKGIHFRIISLYIRDYSAQYSMLEITKLLKINYSNAFKRIKELIEEEILTEKKFGKSNSISINIKNPNTIHLISFVEQSQKITKLEDIIQEIIQIDPFACIGLFGSRVSGKAKKDSDRDVFVITNNRKEVEKVMSQFPYQSNIHLHAFKLDEFKESLKSPEETIVKHIIRNKQIIYNPYPFYNLIKEWEMIRFAPKQ